MFKVIRSDIYRNESGELDVDFYSDSHGGLKSVPGKERKQTPYISDHDSFLNGHKVYSVYTYQGDSDVSIFKDLKKGKLAKDLYKDWVESTAGYIASNIISLERPDIIVVPESSSSLVEDVAKEICRLCKLEYLPNAFKKNPVEDIVLDIPDDIKFTDKSIKKAQQTLDKIVERGKFEAKAFPKQMLKFVKNIYTNDDNYNEILKGKKVAVLDDSMSSKATLANIFDVCDYLYDTAESYGITVFKRGKR